MRDPVHVASMLVAGTLERKLWPELDDESFANDVRERLSTVGLELASADGQWMARVTAPIAEEGFHPFFRLTRIERAVLAAAYLYLRYVPSQPGWEEPGERPSVSVDDLIRPFPYTRRYLENQVLGRLKNMRYIIKERDRIYAGPYLASLDEVLVDERAKPLLERFLIRRHLRQEAEELKPDAPD